MGGLCQGALWRPEAVLAYLSRYTHRVAISNSRPIAFDETGITFRYKDYRRGSADRQQIMTLEHLEYATDVWAIKKLALLERNPFREKPLREWDVPIAA